MNPGHLAQLANVTVKVLGKSVTDPGLQELAMIAFLPFFLGILARVMASREVDKAKLDAEQPAPSWLGRLRPTPRRSMTALGRWIDNAGWVMIAIGAGLLLYVYART